MKIKVRPKLRIPEGLTVAQFQELAQRYTQRWPGVHVCFCAPDGQVVLAAEAKVRGVGEGGSSETGAARRFAIEESLRWGEPAIETGPPSAQGTLYWAVPVMHNALVVGGLVAEITERRLFGRGSGPRLDLREACTDLRLLAEAENLTNAALLESRRHVYQREKERAEAIHAYKLNSGYKLRAAYLLDEPALVAAIRQADRGAARALLNRLLVGMIQHAQGRLDLAKSFFMELVVTLCRAAVEAGGSPEELLGDNFASMSEVSAIKDDEGLALWLHGMLERIMSTMERTRRGGLSGTMTQVWGYIQDHALEQVSRAEVAKAVGVSPTQLSRMISGQMGQSFVDLVNRVRCGKAAELLVKTGKPLKIVALDAGFKDQSYFTKVFRKHMQRTPRQYRLEQGGKR
ncbi:MAG: AraC family transcriptional regulator [Phycisphaerae bacterium]